MARVPYMFLAIDSDLNGNVAADFPFNAPGMNSYTTSNTLK